jgi:hypothetical protein
MVPVVLVFWAPLPRTVRVSLAEVTCCAWLAAASRACRGVSGVLAVLAGPPPDEQAASRISAAADRPTGLRAAGPAAAGRERLAADGRMPET